MIKLLNKQTKHIFILPDEEAFRIKKEDRSNVYEILDAGFQQKEEKKISKKEVEELVSDVDNRAIKIEEEDKKQEEKEKEEEKKLKEGKINFNPKLPKVTENTLDLNKINKKELVNMAIRLNLKASINEHKQVIIDRIKSTGIL